MQSFHKSMGCMRVSYMRPSLTSTSYRTLSRKECLRNDSLVLMGIVLRVNWIQFTTNGTPIDVNPRLRQWIFLKWISLSMQSSDTQIILLLNDFFRVSTNYWTQKLLIHRLLHNIDDSHDNCLLINQLSLFLVKFI